MAPAIAERAGEGKQGLGRREKRLIVTCPNCGAQYRLAPEVVARGARLRCAACDHRWVPVADADPEPPPAAPPPPPRPPVTEADEEAAFAAVQEQLQARWQEPAPPEPVAGDDAPAEPEAADEAAAPRRSGLARTIVAVIAGLALAVVAAGLWVRPSEHWAERSADLGRLPYVGPLLARLDPPSPLRVTIRGQVTVLPSGKRLLEVSGSIANPGPVRAPVPALAASLVGPAGPALRWTIPAPVAMLPAGQQVEFASTVTGFPAEARTLAVAPAG